MEEDRSISKLRSASNLERKRMEVSLYKNYFRTSGGRGTKPFQTSCGRGKKYHFESRAKKKRSQRVIKNSKPRAKKGKTSIHQESQALCGKGREYYSKVACKRRKSQDHQELQASCGRGSEYWFTKIPNLVRKRKGTSKLSNYFESQAEENSNCKVHQKILNLAWNEGRISGIIVMENLEWIR